MSDINLAIVDIEPFRNGDAAARQRVGQAFAHALETAGFAVVTGHGVPEPLAQGTYDAVKQFFAGSMGDKLAYVPPEQTKARGYLPMGIESVAKTLSGETPPDLCEALVFSALHREATATAPNLWPDHPPALRSLVQQWSDAIVGLTQTLWRLCAVALDLPEEHFRPYIADPALVLRFVHYPDQPTPPIPGQLRYGAHHDYGGLTILRQDSAPAGCRSATATVPGGRRGWCRTPSSST